MTDTPSVQELVERIRNRPNDAPMETERLLDDAADALSRLSAKQEGVRKDEELIRLIEIALIGWMHPDRAAEFGVRLRSFLASLSPVTEGVGHE